MVVHLLHIAFAPFWRFVRMSVPLSVFARLVAEHSVEQEDEAGSVHHETLRDEPRAHGVYLFAESMGSGEFVTASPA